MKSLLLAILFSVCLTACSFGVKVNQKDGFVPRTQAQTVFVVPFATIMVPNEVSEGLFDLFVDNLNEAPAQDGLEYIILKQGLDSIDAGWLGSHDYVTGEVFAYVEEIGSSAASIRAKSRIRLFQAGLGAPTLEIEYPVEVFYEKDYSTLEAARRKLAEKISVNMAKKLKEALAGNR